MVVSHQRLQQCWQLMANTSGGHRPRATLRQGRVVCCRGWRKPTEAKGLLNFSLTQAEIRASRAGQKRFAESFLQTFYDSLWGYIYEDWGILSNLKKYLFRLRQGQLEFPSKPVLDRFFCLCPFSTAVVSTHTAVHGQA